MSAHAYRTYLAIFLSSLTCFIIVGYTYLTFNELSNGVKIIQPLNEKFEVVNRVVSPGCTLYYKIHYQKYFDIPGSLSKQLIVEPKNGGEKVYIPLNDTSGHLPVGEVKGIGMAMIPIGTPEGIGQLKLTATYSFGRHLPSPAVVFTEPFEIVK